mmetsp:Transcript_3469/g.7156  ORF Transcript_3469/g.7156 Transcript_3469/m.7156 type:complete len:107 (-) Transcript_3469:965-1285(-)
MVTFISSTLCTSSITFEFQEYCIILNALLGTHIITFLDGPLAHFRVGTKENWSLLVVYNSNLISYHQAHQLSLKVYSSSYYSFHCNFRLRCCCRSCRRSFHGSFAC